MGPLTFTSWNWTRRLPSQPRRRRGRRRRTQLTTLCISVFVSLSLLLRKNGSGADILTSDVSGFGRVYYQSFEDDSSSFYVGRPFLLGYGTAAENVTWLLPPSCSMTSSSNAMAATVIAFCTEIGPSRFRVYPDGDTSRTDTFYITLQEDAGCYIWAFAIGGSNGKSGRFVPNSPSWGYIWAMDWGSATISEKESMRTAPSKLSKSLSKGLYNLGELPSIKFLDDVNMKAISATWVSADSVWMVNFTTGRPGLYATEIKGKDISVLNCRVRSTRQAIPVFKYLDPYDAMYTSLTSTPSKSGIPFSIAIEPCAPNVNYVVGGSYIGSEPGMNIATTQLGLRPVLEKPDSTVLLSLTPFVSGLPTDTNRKIVCTAGSLQGFSALTTDGKVIHHAATRGGFVLSTFELAPTSQLTNIKPGLSFCDVSFGSPTALNSYVLAWSSHPGVSTIYVSTDGGASFAPLVYYRGASPVTVDGQLGAQGLIRDVMVNSVYDRVTVLVRDAYESPTMEKIVSWDIKSRAWVQGFVFPTSWEDSNRTLFDAGSKGAIGGMVVISTSSAEIIAYGNGLFYSPNGGTDFYVISLISRDQKRPAPGLASDEYIAQVVTSATGRFAALTSQNRVFYGKAGVKRAMEVLGGIPPTQEATLSFDVFDRLRVHIPASEQNGYIFTRVLPIDNQVVSPRPPITSNPTLTCPYLEWSSNLTSEYALDIGESLIFEVSVLPGGDSSNTVSITFSNSSLISVMTNSTETSALSVAATASYFLKRRTYTTVIKPHSPAVSGKTNMRVAPSNVDLRCNRAQEYATIHVACPPTRRLVYRSSNYISASRSAWDCSRFSSKDVPESITLENKEYISDYSTMTYGPKKEVPYNCSRFGPPTRLYYGSMWKPVFDLYDGDTFVQTVMGDVVLFEQNGKLTFSYNTTVEQAGCIRPPQTWLSMVAKNPSQPFDTWTEDNYAPCYVGELGDISTVASQSYQILNATNYNAVHWTGQEDGIFIFLAKVLDRNTSYCVLTTEFAVHVYGAPLRAGVQAGIVLALTVGFMTILAGSYAWYRREHMMKEKEQ